MGPASVTLPIARQSAARYLVAAIAVFFGANWLLYGGETIDQKTVEKSVEETYEDLRSSWNQITSFGVPTYNHKRKARLGRWTFDRERCVVLNETFLAVGMRVPKAASSTLQGLVEGLASKNHFALSSVVERHSSKNINRSDEEHRLVSYLSAFDRRTVHTAHIPFLNFGPLGSPRPVYFSTIRDPYLRLSSHYDYVHFGPRPLFTQVVHQDTAVETFAQCVAGHKAGKRNTRTHFDCLQTAGLQIRFFCGISEFCRRTSPVTLEVALANVELNFAAVVVVERMLESFEVLEAALPSLFKGLVMAYHGASGVGSSGGSGIGGKGGGGGGTELHARANEASKASGGVIDPSLKAFVMDNENLKLEYGLYRFAEERLTDQMRACKITPPKAATSKPAPMAS